MRISDWSSYVCSSDLLSIPRKGASATAFIGLRLRADHRLDAADGAGLRAHHHRLHAMAAGHPLDALQQAAVGHARGGEDHVAGATVGQAVFAVELPDAEPAGAAALVLVADDRTSVV